VDAGSDSDVRGTPLYQIESSSPLLRARRRLLSGRRWRSVPRTVVLLGLTSFFTDISSEMVATVLPLYLIYGLRLAPAQFGVIDGIYQGGSILVRLASGFIADRWQRPKGVATVGYALSALTRPALLVAQGAGAITALVLVDRVGKGIRTAPRDAMISRSSPEADLATYFGVHRALDTAGAMLGPLIAFALLALVPGVFDPIFVVSFCFAIIGLGIIGLVVDDAGPVAAVPVVADRAETPSAVSVRSAAGLLRRPGFRLLLPVASLLAVLTISDSFVYLALQQHLDLDFSVLPLLYLGTALIYMMLAIPIGRLADRVGRGAIFVAGYVVLAFVYVSLLAPPFGAAQVLTTVLALGAYYAMTEGVLQAVATVLVPAELRASGLGMLATATGLGRLFSSILFGIAWTVMGLGTAIALFLGGLVAAILLAALALRRQAAGLAHG
jgi:MFS family permease